MSLTRPLFSLLLILLRLLAGARTSPAERHPLTTPHQNGSLEYMDPTLPPLLPFHTPKCSLLVLCHIFAGNVSARPVSAPYIPPHGCPAPWARVLLDLSAAASGLQKDRTAALWLDGAEILRTTTPLPLSPGVFWRVRKDVTRYSSLLKPGAALSMMLDDRNNSGFPGGAYAAVNVSLHFYRGPLKNSSSPAVKGLYGDTADAVIPISNAAGGKKHGFWFKVRNGTEVRSAAVVVPNNTYRAVLEMYASHHGDDEYWYINPLRKSTKKHANGGFRQIMATVDGRYVGSAIPFPVIYPGSINPFFWAPVAAIGAYDHPSYDVDLTPFVGDLIDGQAHEFGLGVRDSQPYWLVSANLHVWVDQWEDAVEGGLIRYKAPPLKLDRSVEWKRKDGKSDVEGETIHRFAGWVSSSKGNVTTAVRHKVKFKSHVEVEGKGARVMAQVENRARIDVKMVRDDVVVGRAAVETSAPLEMRRVSSKGSGGSRLQRTRLIHGLHEMRSIEEEKKGPVFSSVEDRQVSVGSVVMEPGKGAVWGRGDTKSIYMFRDDKACYRRTLSVVGGEVKEDRQTDSCDDVATS